MNDAIKHPKHYTEGRRYEPKDVIRNWQLNLANVSQVLFKDF